MGTKRVLLYFDCRTVITLSEKSISDILRDKASDILKPQQ